MRISTTVSVATLAILMAAPAFAQDASGQAGDQSAAESYPEACMQMDAASGAQMATPHAEMDMSGMQEHQRAAMEGMMEMHRKMMQGMMAEDPDVAFICGMIAHHQGAIHMAQVELKYGDDERAKEMAQKIIGAQTQEISEMKAWLQGNVQ